jgi:LysM repeat protein
MTALTKAYLAEITSGDSPQELPDTKVDVQFNPTSLRIQIANKTAGGQQAGAQARQRPGTGEMQVSFDLVFDTADEGSTADGVSVLDKTKSVERFVRPKGPRAGQEAPPRVTFVWGTFQVQGTMESANIDLDLFDAKGVPLRAKVSVSIKGQDPRWTYTPAPAPTGGGGASGGGKTPPAGAKSGLPSGAPGTKGNGLSPDRILQAIPGESLAQLAARAGFDPSAWRALAAGLSNPLKLELGQEIPLPAGSGKSAATGATAQGADTAKTAAALPLVPPGQAAPGGGSTPAAGGPRSGAAAAEPVRQGQAVAQKGGLSGAIAQVKSDAHQQSAASSLASFGVAASATADVDDRPWGAGVPLRPRFGGTGATAQRAGPAARARSVASVRPLGASRLSKKTSCACGCKGS